MGETILELQNIAKHFGDTDVLNGISISIGKGEFITLLGPSGCGKTTTLRIIAGLETPDEGRVILNGQDVTDSEPNKRDVNTVFQNYALFPHMTVAANIGYSLKLKKRPKDEIKKAVDDALALVQLSGYGKRMPAELSGGQRQRVAIARAVVNRPSVLLLDEPLGALDLQLRRQMQLELKALQKQLGITFIYITHDQEEALNMSDRIAVMKDGRFEQLGTPAEVYDSPRTSYVARFVGTANVLTGTVEAVEDDVLKVACAGGCAGALRRGYSFAPGAPITLAVRSEHVEFTKDPAACGIAAVIREKTFAGGMLRIALELSDGTTLIASRHGIDMDVQTGDAVRVTWAPASAVPVDVEADAAAALPVHSGVRGRASGVYVRTQLPDARRGMGCGEPVHTGQLQKYFSARVPEHLCGVLQAGAHQHAAHLRHRLSFRLFYGKAARAVEKARDAAAHDPVLDQLAHPAVRMDHHFPCKRYAG